MLILVTCQSKIRFAEDLKWLRKIVWHKIDFYQRTDLRNIKTSAEVFIQKYGVGT